MKRKLLSVLCVFIAASSAIPAAAGQPLAQRIQLDSGMVLLIAERREIPMVTVSMSVRAGTTAEPREKPGVASLAASLMMQGTTRRSASQINREIDFIGGSLSVSAGDDFATAGLRVLKKDIRAGFDLLADVLMRPAFEQQEIDRKVKETLAAIRQQKEDPATIAGEAFTKTVFGPHPYGVISDDVAAFLPVLRRQDLLDFYRAHYAPDSVVMAVVGDVSAREVVGLVREYFKEWKPLRRPHPAAVPAPRIEKTIVRKLEKDITQANIAVGHLGISRENPDYYAVMVMNYILGGGGFSSRLMDNIRDNRGLAYDVHSSFSAQKDPGPFQVWVQTKNESANDAIDEIIKELKRIRTELVTDAELADAKAYLTGSFPLRMDTSAKIAGILTNIELFGLGLDYPQRYPALINGVTKEDILRVAKTYLAPDRMAIVVLGNQEKINLRSFE